MSGVIIKQFWPSARDFAEAMQCPAVCFADPALKAMLPAVDRLGMPLVTSGQFAYVFKLNAHGGGRSLAVRCFRGFMGDREERYRALDAHLNACHIAALPRFRYLPSGMLVAGRRFPVLVMDWVTGPTLDVYLGEVLDRPEVLLHLAGEWLKLMESLRAAGVAHGDLQHGNVIVERGQLRLVDLDGMFVPALAGLQASEVGHQHYQHPSRDANLFSLAVDNFAALAIYLSLLALAERPALWAEHHDENLLFTRQDFLNPDASALFEKIKGLSAEHARLAEALASAAKSDPSETPWLLDLVQVRSKLPSWMSAPSGVEVGERTREVARSHIRFTEAETLRATRRVRPTPQPFASGGVQTLFGSAPLAATRAQAVLDPSDVYGNTLFYLKRSVSNTYAYVWWIPLHNILLEELWAASYITGASAVLCSLMLFCAVFLLYGILRAVYEAETAGQQPQQPHAIGSLGPPVHTLAGAPHAVSAVQPQSFFASPAPAAATTAQPAAAPRPVVGNRSLSIYHLHACAWAAKIAPQHRAEFDSPLAAQAARYRPCRVCAP